MWVLKFNPGEFNTFYVGQYRPGPYKVQTIGERLEKPQGLKMNQTEPSIHLWSKQEATSLQSRQIQSTLFAQEQSMNWKEKERLFLERPS